MLYLIFKIDKYFGDKLVGVFSLFRIFFGCFMFVGIKYVIIKDGRLFDVVIRKDNN